MAKKTADTTNSKTGIFDLIKSLNKDAEIIAEAKWCNSDDYIGTGSYILNAAISGSLFGGLPNRRSMMYAGESGAGKSFLAASMAREAQAKDYTVIVLDSEGAWDKDFAARIGVDITKLIIVPVNLISEVNSFIANLCEKIKETKSKDKVFIILDSIGNLTSDKERQDTIDGSDKRDMTKQQQLKALFRVNGLKLSQLAIPFLIINHVYAKTDFLGGVEVSGGSGLRYNPSITMILTKAKLEDKEGEKIIEKNKGTTNYTRSGVLVTASPFKSRFTRPVKVKFQIPFFKRPNPYVGLEPYLTWENSGVLEGEILHQKEYDALSVADKEKMCYPFTFNGETLYAHRKVAKRTCDRKIVVARLGQELPIVDLFSDKVFTDELLHKLDEEVIKPLFQLPSQESADDLDEFFETGEENEENS